MNMDEGLIVREYNQAKDKNKQVQILAELNNVHPSKIIEILTERGAISGIKKTVQTRKATIWTPDMDREVSSLASQGMNLKEIAERMGIDVQAIYSRRKYLKSIPKTKDINQKQQKKNIVPAGKGVFTETLSMLAKEGYEISEASMNLLTGDFKIIGTKTNGLF